MSTLAGANRSDRSPKGLYSVISSCNEITDPETIFCWTRFCSAIREIHEIPGFVWPGGLRF